MKFAVYDGSLVEVHDEQGNLVCIRDQYEMISIEKSKLVLVPAGIADAELQELANIKQQIHELLRRMNNLDAAYTEKKERLRECYINERSKEIALVNQILTKSHQL